MENQVKISTNIVAFTALPNAAYFSLATCSLLEGCFCLNQCAFSLIFPQCAQYIPEHALLRVACL